MKFKHLWIALSALLAAGCSDEEALKSPLKLVESQLQFSAEGGKGFVRIAAPQGEVQAKVDQDWCSLSIKNDTIEVSVLPNVEMGGRTSLLSIVSGNERVQAPVSQAGAILALSSSDVQFTDDGGRVGIRVKNTLNEPYTVELQDNSGSDSDPNSWLTYKITNDSLFFIAKPTTLRNRKDTATLMLNNRRLKIGIEQMSISGRYIASYFSTSNDALVPHTDDTVWVQKQAGTNFYNISGFEPNNASGNRSYKNTLVCSYSNRRLVATSSGIIDTIEHTSKGTDYKMDTVYLSWWVVSYYNQVATNSPDPTYVAPIQIKGEHVTLPFADGGTWMMPIDGIATGGNRKSDRYYIGLFDRYYALKLESIDN